MKISTEGSKQFRPVTIVLETLPELEYLTSAMGTAARECSQSSWTGSCECQEMSKALQAAYRAQS